MKKLIIFLILLIAITGGFFVLATKNKTSVANQPESPKVEDVIKQKIATMSLDEKIGQLLIVGFDHVYIDDHIKTMISQYHIGGINLLGHNIQNAQQTRDMITGLQALSAIPIFMATDQEGGEVVRFKFLKELTSELNIKDTATAESIGKTRAQELLGLGVNMDFSPVMDYVSDKNAYLYSRTFGATPEQGGELGQAMIKGYLAGGVIPVAKHFPGYGNIAPDPHKNASVLNISQKELETNLIPFKAVVDSAPAIMTAHILIPAVDSKPATLSATFLNSILRKELGFKGVIITDDMEMISAGSSVTQNAVEAIKAGADMIIDTDNSQRQIGIFKALKTAVQNKEISQDQLDASVYRILKLKTWMK